MKPVVFVHTNDYQLLAALVSIYSLRRNCQNPQDFEVRLLRLEGSDIDGRRDGQAYSANGEKTWDHTEQNAFHLIRRSVPSRMNFGGRALVLDPDVFAVSTIAPLLNVDMQGKAIWARYIGDGFLGDGKAMYSTGVMLLDCTKLTHWTWEDEIHALFSGRADYWDLMQLSHEDPSSIGELSEDWNSMDKLTAETRLLHFTRVSTQPWKTGLPLPDDIYDPTAPWPFASRIRRHFSSRPLRRYRRHPSATQEKVFFDLLADCLNDGALPESFIAREITNENLRPDAPRLLARSGFQGGPTRPDAGLCMLKEFGLAI
jgi:hypothetical protein